MRFSNFSVGTGNGRRVGQLLALLMVVGLMATALLQAPASVQAARNWPVYQSGSTGENVVTLQYMLRYRGYQLSVDGSFGSGTASVVKQFQSSKGLTADGVVGSQTWDALIAPSATGSKGDHVTALQRQLNVQGYGLTVDGSYGAGTDSAVRDFKTKHNLAADGGAGLDTWAALVGGGSGSGGSRAQIAQNLINSGRVDFWQRHDSGVSDNATAYAEIHQTAQSLQATRSSYGTAPGGSVYLSVDMLSGLQTVSKTYTLSISELAGGSHSNGSRHYDGIAFDVASINGVGVTASNPNFRNLMQMCRNLGATEVLGPGDANHDTHIHCAWPRP